MSDAVIVGCIAALPPTLLALAAFVQSLFLGRGQTGLKNQLDGRLEQLLKATNKIARAAGKREGQALPRKRPPRKRG